MEENEIEEHMSEGSLLEQEETESGILIDGDSESLEESQNYSPSFWTRQQNVLKLLAAFFLLATGLVLGGLFVYLSDDEPPATSQITFQLGETPGSNHLVKNQW